MNFNATKARVKTQGCPPNSFLEELVNWARSAPEEIFLPNLEHDDIYNHVLPQLGPWTSFAHRRAAMLEVMRAHAGFESSWNWLEGVDTTNKTSMANKTGQETGIFQVSFDSEFLNHSAMRSFALRFNISGVDDFIIRMKYDHVLALEYYARLIRFNTKWAGPITRGEILPWLSRSSMNEFQDLLA